MSKKVVASFDGDEEANKEISEVEAKQNSRDVVAGFTIPREYIRLPSMGKIYPKTSSLHGLEEIELHQMTAAEEDILTSRALIRSGKAIDMVISSCIIDKTINVDDLLNGDKNAIMLAIRVGGYGKEYAIPVICPSCETEERNNVWDLSKLQMNMLDSELDVVGENIFSVELPSKNVVKFKLLNSGEEKELSEILEKQRRLTGAKIDRGITTRFKRVILSVNGDDTPNIISQFSEKMSANDSRALRKCMDKTEPDVLMEQEFTCPTCGEVNVVNIQLTPEFFWPQ